MIWLRNRVRSKLTGNPFPVSHELGYPLRLGYSPEDHIEELLSAVQPDCIFVQSPYCGPLVERTESCGLPVVVYLHNCVRGNLLGDAGNWPWARFIANSEFARGYYQDEMGIDSTVIYPFVDFSDAKVDAPGDSVLFVNPVPEKGVDIAIELVKRLPGVPFLFQEAWPLGPDQIEKMRRELAGCTNFELLRRTLDKKSFYRRAKILLTPSRWLEGFGRVAVEAQTSGIPVVSSNRGALAETVGDGGEVIADLEDLDAWIQAVERLMSDPAYYREKSLAASENATRQEFSRDHIIKKLISVLSAPR
jgi:glycosyltransferase involved in cell wall biosynthesis